MGVIATRSSPARALTFPEVPRTSPSAARRRLAAATCWRAMCTFPIARRLAIDPDGSAANQALTLLEAVSRADMDVTVP